MNTFSVSFFGVVSDGAWEGLLCRLGGLGAISGAKREAKSHPKRGPEPESGKLDFVAIYYIW